MLFARSRKKLKRASGWSWLLGIFSLLYTGFRSLPRRGEAMAVLVLGSVGIIFGGVVGTVYVFASPDNESSGQASV